ncbi:hypothetical protein SAMN04487897_1171, partial [Paenibacillus sp. yr247]|uniref:hypothetical protein n=1 Tax=Paenibacillus sp. yr247 TaxID=1761880 RepID=UPI0008801AB8
MAKNRNDKKLSAGKKNLARMMAVTMAVTPVVAVLPGMVSAATNSSTANDVATLGLVGTTATSDAVTVATAAIN